MNMPAFIRPTHGRLEFPASARCHITQVEPSVCHATVTSIPRALDWIIPTKTINAKNKSAATARGLCLVWIRKAGPKKEGFISNQF